VKLQLTGVPSGGGDVNPKGAIVRREWLRVGGSREENQLKWLLQVGGELKVLSSSRKFLLSIGKHHHHEETICRPILQEKIAKKMKKISGRSNSGPKTRFGERGLSVVSKGRRGKNAIGKGALHEETGSCSLRRKKWPKRREGGEGATKAFIGKLE